jgi:DNA-binding winged helix-turn-helix (wHTH) protein
VAGLPDSADTLYAGELEIRLEDGLVLATGQVLTLSVREFELLVAMARRAGSIVTREELYRTVWGGELRAGDRSVDVYVSKLRGKLEKAMPDRRFIHTHPGFGYRFQPQTSREPDFVRVESPTNGHANMEGATSTATDNAADDAADSATHGAAGATSRLSRNVHIGAAGD